VNTEKWGLHSVSNIQSQTKPGRGKQSNHQLQQQDQGHPAVSMSTPGASRLIILLELYHSNVASLADWSTDIASLTTASPN